MDKLSQEELARIYDNRFGPAQTFRRLIWQVLIRHFFQKFIPETGAVLDLGCGYGEFVNSVKARMKYGMDLNPNSRQHLQADVSFIHQDCSLPWPLAPGDLDVVFTSNFFEHLPNKQVLGKTLEEAFRCLKPCGKLIALGPNIRFTGGRYWDFWDHYLPLTEASLSEGLTARGFRIETCYPRFLPYTMVGGPQYPLWMLVIYLRLPLLWRIAGKQFLIIANKPT